MWPTWVFWSVLLTFCFHQFYHEFYICDPNHDIPLPFQHQTLYPTGFIDKRVEVDSKIAKHAAYAVPLLTRRGQRQRRHAVVGKRSILKLQALLPDFHLHTALTTKIVRYLHVKSTNSPKLCSISSLLLSETEDFTVFLLPHTVHSGICSVTCIGSISFQRKYDAITWSEWILIWLQQLVLPQFSSPRDKNVT